MQFDFTVQAGGAQVVEVVGRFVKYVGGIGKIRVRFDKGGYLDLLPGQGASGLDFAKLVIEDRSGSINIGVLLAGNFAFVDDRITGSVEVIDGGRNRTAANMAFGMAGYQVPTANQYLAVQLFNPANSGVNTIVESVKTSSNTGWTGGIGVSFTPAGMAVGAQSGYGYSKLANGALSKSQNRNGSFAVAPSPGNGYPQIWGFASGVANSETSYKFTEPLVIPPNYGLIMWGNNNTTAGIDLSASFEFYEQTINT